MGVMVKGYDYKGGGWKKLKRGKMRATRLIETLSRIAVVERVKLHQLLRLKPEAQAFRLWWMVGWGNIMFMVNFVQQIKGGRF